MRVSTSMMYGRMIHRVSAQMSRLAQAQDQVSSGTRIQRPSDDPVGAGRATILESNLSDLAQYQSNNRSANATLTATENAVATIGSALREARRLTVTGGNAAISESEREILAEQLDRIIQRVRDTAQTQYAGRYLFSGTAVHTRPLETSGDNADPYVYAGNNGQGIVEIADGVTITTNVSGRSLLNFDGTGDPTAPNVFATLSHIRDRVRAGSVEEVSASLETLDRLMANNNRHLAEVGQAIQRLDVNLSHLQEQSQVFAELRSNITDIDLAESLVEYSTREMVYQATISLAARMDRPGLLELLR